MVKMKKKIILCLCFTLLLVTGCGKVMKLKNGEEIVAAFDKEKITADTLYKEIKDRYARNVLIDMIDTTILDKKYPTDETMNSTIDQQIEYIKGQTKGEFLAAIKYYYGVNTEADFRKVLLLEEKRKLATKDYAKSVIKDSEINDYYASDIVGDIKASHILIKPDVTDNMTDEEKTNKEKEALATAKDVISQLNNGAKFTDLAKKYSADKANADKGGDLGFFNKGTMDANFEKAAYDLEKGKYTTEPVKSQFGYHIILKTDSKAKPELKLVKADIIDKLADKLITDKTTTNVTTLIELRKTNKLKIYDAELKAQYDAYMNELSNPTTTTTQQ
jgi:foldase protein PrsA